MLRRIVHIILLLSLSCPAFSQLQPLLDQYQFNELAVNPAYSGSQEALSAGLYSRIQWVGFKGAPRTFTFSIHSPLRNKKVNLGLVLLSDRLGSRKETGFLFNYAYRIDLNNGKLSFGLAAGFTHLSTDLNSIQAVDPGDVLLQDPARRFFLPEFSFGIYYYTRKYYISFSMPSFLSHTINNEAGKYKLGFDLASINYMLSAGYVFKLSKYVDILPSIMLRTSPAYTTQADINCNVIYKEKIWLGASIRTNSSMSANFQLQINPQLRIGYSYGYELSELSSYQSGSHEFRLVYNFRYKLDVIGPRYF